MVLDFGHLYERTRHFPGGYMVHVHTRSHFSGDSRPYSARHVWRVHLWKDRIVLTARFGRVFRTKEDQCST